VNGVTQAEFSRVIDATALAEAGETFRYEASGIERASIASWLSLISLGRLEAVVEAIPASGGGVRLKVEFTADVVQPCVTTLEPVATCLQEAFELLYLPEIPWQNSRPAGAISVDVDLEVDEPELLVGSKIDAGEAITEHLVLTLDPYPRKSNAALDSGYLAAGNGQNSPFSVLQELKVGR
jgi:uncharacterized metal-binding protein YceD (DUF177 family)